MRELICVSFSKVIFEINFAFMKALIEESEFEFESKRDGLYFNNHRLPINLLKSEGAVYTYNYRDKNYTIDLLGYDEESKEVLIKIQGKKCSVRVTDEFDALLASMGMDAKSSKKSNEIKAPMPGMVLRVMVTEGQQVNKGDGILVLEAMKMENIIKATNDCEIQKIMVGEKDKVEKNQVLIQLV